MSQSIKESDFIFYRGEDGKMHAQVILGDETVWVSQNGMTEIFQSSKQNVSYHIGNIFKDGELDEISVVKELLTTGRNNCCWVLNQFISGQLSLRSRQQEC